MPPRTIDNLGVDVSTRYAEDRKTLDESLIKEAALIPQQAEIEVTAPFLPSEMDSLLGTQPTYTPWASFTAPLSYFEQKKKQLFTHQLIPSMGSMDKNESQTQKILAKMQSLTESQELKQSLDKEKRVKREEEEREKKILTSLLNTINQYDKMIIDINSRRSQYQKG